MLNGRLGHRRQWRIQIDHNTHAYVSVFVVVVVHLDWAFLFSNSFSLFSIDDILATIALLTDRLRLSQR